MKTIHTITIEDGEGYKAEIVVSGHAKLHELADEKVISQSGTPPEQYPDCDE